MSVSGWFKIRLLRVLYVVAIAGCGKTPPPPENEVNITPLSGEQQFIEADDALKNDEETDSMADWGWRRGRVELRMDFSYAIAVEEIAKNESRREVRYQHSGYVQGSAPVWLPPQFLLSPPEGADEDSLRDFYESDIFQVENGERIIFPNLASEVNYGHQMRVVEPRASEFVLIEVDETASGTIENFEISRVHPSVIAEGFEAIIEFKLNLTGTRQQLSVYAGGHRNTFNEPYSNNDLTTFQFFPAVVSSQPRQIPTWTWQDISLPEIRNMLETQFAETFQNLRKVHESRWQGPIRTDLSSNLENGILVLRYHAVDDRHIALIPDILTMEHLPQTNSLTLIMQFIPD